MGTPDVAQLTWFGSEHSLKLEITNLTCNYRLLIQNVMKREKSIICMQQKECGIFLKSDVSKIQKHKNLKWTFS